MRQAARVALMNLRSIPGRLGISLVICVGSASVVAVLVTVLSMATGLMDTMTAGVHPDRVLVMRKGALAESLSSLPREAVLAVETAPGIAILDGRPAVSPEVVLSVTLPRLDGEGDSAVFLRGLTDSAWSVRPEIALASGRRFESGRFEVMVGTALQQQLVGVAIGDTLSFYSNHWAVVGIFESEGGAAESQLLTDAATLMSVANRNVYSSAAALLADPRTFEVFKIGLEENPQLLVEAFLETDYYQRQAESASRILRFIAYVVGAIMALGALFGSVNTMYTAVAARTAEIATLRAMGFGGAAVVVSVLAEALFLSVIGAGLGAGASWLLFNGMNFNAGGQLATIGVRLEVGLPVILVGVIWASVIGMLAGLLPAVRAARMSVVDGLRVSA